MRAPNLVSTLALSFSLVLAAFSAGAEETANAASENPPACKNPDASQADLKDLLKQLLPLSNTVAIDFGRQQRMIKFLTTGAYKGWCADYAPRSNGIRATGPIVRGPNRSLSFATHARARVFYSKEVVQWLRNDRKGEIVDGAMIVKEMYPYPSTIQTGNTEPIAGWAVMIRDQASSHMGWIWGLYFEPGNQTFLREYMTIQPGLSYCSTCHASTDTSQGTFAFLGNLYNENVATYVQAAPVFDTNNSALADLLPESLADLDPHSSFKRYYTEVSKTMYTSRGPQPLSNPNSAVLSMLRSQLSLESVPLHAELKRLPLDFLYDRKLPLGDAEGNKSDNNHQKKDTFYTSSACVGCHNAANLLSNQFAHGQLPVDPQNWSGFSQLNVTPYGEWQGSMMAMSGRDPIFRAQVEWEAASIDDHAKRGEVTQLCMSCHSVMGEREFPEQARDLKHTYAFPDIDNGTHPQSDSSGYEYAALARDGVSCTVCHRISAKDLGSPETFTGHFTTGPADKIYGPFESVKTLPMQNAVGMTPVGADHIKSSALCGSCHAINLPVLQNDREVKTTYEQTTYLEWLNSKYSKGIVSVESASESGSGDSKSCQDCHMTGVNPAEPSATLDIPIANIEDSSFPYVPNRATAEELDIESRSNYRRHTLVGANLFGLNMFAQFPELLGAHLFWAGQDPSVVFSRSLAIEETRQQVQQRTATVEITNIDKKSKHTVVSVRVTNLAGHKLPSGVGFRRAFLELQVLDKDGQRLWCSGCTNDAGVIVNNQQQPLASEFARTEQELELDRELISSSDQVQIYEHRALDCDDALTTSFVRICKEVKDNRLLPAGWRKKGPYAKVTSPVGQKGKLTPGKDKLSYEIPSKVFERAEEIRVVLNYQSIPPYYLVDRFKLLSKEGNFPESERLLYMVLHLNTESTKGMNQWKTPVACESRRLVFDPDHTLGMLPVNCIAEL